jgi:diguanylate cyclase (GGDEF)-like protein
LVAANRPATLEGWSTCGPADAGAQTSALEPAEDTGPARRKPSKRAFRVLAVGGGSWVGLHIAGVLGPLADLTFALLGLASVAATLTGLRRFHPANRWPWIVTEASLILFLFGGVIRLQFETVGNLTGTRSLLPDLVSLPGYLLAGAGLTGLVRARGRQGGRDVDALLDGLVACLAALALAWVYLINPSLLHEQAPISVRLVLACYPPMSVFLVAVAVRVTFSWGVRPTPAQKLLLASITSMLVGDVIYMFVDARLVSIPQPLVDAPYAMAFLIFGLTALHPTMRELTEPPSTLDSAPTRARLALVAVALVMPALVSLGRGDARGGDRVVLIVTVIALTAIATGRMLRALRAHARSEARFAHQATHDALTGLPNRLYVREHVNQAIGRARSDGRHMALLFLDMDRFKLVNDTFGHTLGDELLIAIARRLLDNVREDDVVARIGGDEFVVILAEVADLQEAIRSAERIHLALQAPFLLRGNDIYSSASVGVAFADESADAESLIRDADTAMYQAKEAGRDGVAVFDASMRDRVAERLALEQDLRSALVEHQLHLHFQPILGLEAGDVVGFEALVRWTHPSRGLVPPITFIPIAEDTGMINEIGLFVLDHACAHLTAWRSTLAGATDLSVAVNVSARQLRDRAFVTAVEDILSRHRLPGNALCLELTESLLMDDPDAAAAMLREVRALGVRLSIDDFGTGYSSLSYLKRFPVNQVKIDRSFVEGLDDPDSSEESLVAAIIAMADALGMTTIAEGVETAAQSARLRQLGCARVQGYLYSRPLPPNQVPAMLSRLGLGAPSPAPVD